MKSNPLKINIFLQMVSHSFDKNMTVNYNFQFLSEWMECMDNTTGYPYYWNKKTNEVSWDKPPGFASSKDTASRDATNVKEQVEKKTFSTKLRKTISRSRSPTVAQAFIGPTLPQLTPEEIARNKVIKFEDKLAKDIYQEILKEDPPDWKRAKPQKGLYSKPFAWRKKATCLQTYR